MGPKIQDPGLMAWGPRSGIQGPGFSTWELAGSRVQDLKELIVTAHLYAFMLRNRPTHPALPGIQSI